MNRHFVLFGWVHIAILGAVPVLAGGLAFLARRSPHQAWLMRLWFGGLLGINELFWYWYNIHKGWYGFPDHLPLNLCDLTVWLTVAALLTLNSPCYELAYFIGVGGSSMALLTPDLWEDFPSYPTIYFFVAHGGLVAGVLYLTWARLSRPLPGCVWRVLGWLNAYACVIGVFNLVFKANYVYLCHKPANASLLDYFGPWPLYIVTGEVFALICFYLLWLPFRKWKG